jgi:hypothetical protein
MYVQTVAAYEASFFYAELITRFEVRYLFASTVVKCRLEPVGGLACLSVTPYPNV